MEELWTKFKSLSFKQKCAVCLLFGFSALSLVYLFFYQTPDRFPLGQVVTIYSGQSLQEITDNLYNTHVIKSPFVFRTHVIILGGEKRVIAGDYLLDSRVGPADLAYRLVEGKFHLPVVKMTIPEGWNVFEIGDYLEKKLLNFNKKLFLTLAKEKEGYLFPDTYFVSPTAKPEEIVERMYRTFEQKIISVPGFSTTTRPIKDIIIMASIIEDEARTTESRQIISGILWKRLSIKMALQVDSAFKYINGKNTFELTAGDLKINSPYNTYLYNGLPQGPIGNPGLDSIFSALNPINTKYLYFLTSRDGKTIHYAKTFEEHKKNRELYLNH